MRYWIAGWGFQRHKKTRVAKAARVDLLRSLGKLQQTNPSREGNGGNSCYRKVRLGQ